MRKVFIIAGQHLSAAFKSKSFWLGIAMMPIMAGIGVFLTQAAQSNIPTIRYALVDQSNTYYDAIQRILDLGYARGNMGDYSRYFLENRRENWADGALTDKQRSAVNIWTDYLDGRGNQAFESIIEFGGMSEFVAVSGDFLEPDTVPFSLPTRRLVKVDLPEVVNLNGTDEEIVEQVRPYLLGRPIAPNGPGLDALVFVHNNNESATIEYWSTNATNNLLSNVVQQAVDQKLQARVLTDAGVGLELLDRIENTKAELQRFDPKKERGQEQRNLADFVKLGVPYVFAFILFMVFFISGGALLQSVLEEKSNKLIEVFLSSVTPGQLMAGKLLGVASVSLTIIISWAGLAILATFLGLSASEAPAVTTAQVGLAQSGLEQANFEQADFEQLSITSEQMQAFFAAMEETVRVIPVFIFSFICGYIIFSSLWLAVGSLCASPQDANTLLTPLSLLMMVPMFLIGIVVPDPNGTVATVMTWIPLYTPLMLLVRFSADPPLIELLGACGILILLTIATVLISLRIFRYGVLYSGETPKMVQVIRLAFSKRLSAQ